MELLQRPFAVQLFSQFNLSQGRSSLLSYCLYSAYLFFIRVIVLNVVVVLIQISWVR